MYFSLKDRAAQINAVMFKSRYARNSFKDFQEGDEVVVSGSVTIYAQRSAYQIQVDALQPAGKGELFAQFLNIKARLEAEGLFAAERKRKLPPYPRKLVLITSPTGAAVRDVLQTIARRFPAVEVCVIPAIVQGPYAPQSLRDALAVASRLESVDAILLTRGGGSIEDLWGFNDEDLARVIARAPFPVVSAVGHETDFTIADFASDARAPTPTAAAEMTTPDVSELRRNWSAFEQSLRQYARRMINDERQLNDALFEELEKTGRMMVDNRKTLLSDKLEAFKLQAKWLLQNEKQSLEKKCYSATSAFSALLARQRIDLTEKNHELQKFDFESMKAYGYAVAEINGKRAGIQDLNPDEVFSLILKGGRIAARVEDKKTE